MQSEPRADESTERAMGCVSSPIGSHLHCPKRLKHHPPSILNGSLSLTPSSSTCGKKTSYAKPERRRQSHEVLKEHPSPGPKGSFQNCGYRLRAASGNMKKVHVWGLDQPPSWMPVLSRDLPLCPVTAKNEVPITRLTKVINLSSIFIRALLKSKC